MILLEGMDDMDDLNCGCDPVAAGMAEFSVEGDESGLGCACDVVPGMSDLSAAKKNKVETAETKYDNKILSAQQKYNTLVSKYGVNSKQAKAALDEVNRLLKVEDTAIQKAKDAQKKIDDKAAADAVAKANKAEEDKKKTLLSAIKKKLNTLDDNIKKLNAQVKSGYLTTDQIAPLIAYQACLQGALTNVAAVCTEPTPTFDVLWSLAKDAEKTAKAVAKEEQKTINENKKQERKDKIEEKRKLKKKLKDGKEIEVESAQESIVVDNLQNQVGTLQQAIRDATAKVTSLKEQRDRKKKTLKGLGADAATYTGTSQLFKSLVDKALEGTPTAMPKGCDKAANQNKPKCQYWTLSESTRKQTAMLYSLIFQLEETLNSLIAQIDALEAENAQLTENQQTQAEIISQQAETMQQQAETQATLQAEINANQNASGGSTNTGTTTGGGAADTQSPGFIGSEQDQGGNTGYNGYRYDQGVSPQQYDNNGPSGYRETFSPPSGQTQDTGESPTVSYEQQRLMMERQQQQQTQPQRQTYVPATFDASVPDDAGLTPQTQSVPVASAGPRIVQSISPMPETEMVPGEEFVDSEPVPATDAGEESQMPTEGDFAGEQVDAPSQEGEGGGFNPEDTGTIDDGQDFQTGSARRKQRSGDNGFNPEMAIDSEGE